MKKIISVILCCTMLLTFGSTAMAQELTQEQLEEMTPNLSEGTIIGLSESEPIWNQNFSTFGLNKPTSTYNPEKQGAYTLGGETQGYTLYSNYIFYGQTDYKLYIKNFSNNKLIVKFKKGVLISKRVTVDPGEAVTISYSTGSTSTQFYLQFDVLSGVIDFSGVIY